jgi:hypothetical protein
MGSRLGSGPAPLCSFGGVLVRARVLGESIGECTVPPLGAVVDAAIALADAGGVNATAPSAIRLPLM